MFCVLCKKVGSCVSYLDNLYGKIGKMYFKFYYFWVFIVVKFCYLGRRLLERFLRVVGEVSGVRMLGV